MNIIKKYLKPLLTGIGLALTMVLVMLKLTMDFQVLLFIGTFLFLVSGHINSKSKGHQFITLAIIVLPFLSLFILIVLAQIPELNYFVLIYLASSIIGFYFVAYKRKATLSLALLSVILIFLAIKVIPLDLERSLTQTKSEPLPDFNMIDMSGKVLNSKDLKGKIIVLDFFGTWCRPCVQELVELDKIQENFKDDQEVAFYIINIDVGGDTREKFQAFI
ncbi:MAG: TlpA family protein disulfide reductase, partial [Flavobacteriaceae bacterium]|nr:TlpA family protein disulfide reductase [Flavobacteriaceae bacterium]